MLADFFSFKLNLSTLLVMAVALVFAGGLYPLYMRARLAAGFRVGLNPSQVRLGAVALSLALFCVLTPLAKSWGVGWSLIGLVAALALAWTGRNRGLPILAIAGALVLVLLVSLIRPAVL